MIEGDFGNSVLLIAEDDEDDRLLVEDAISESTLRNEVRFVRDGVDLLHYLRHEGVYADAPTPALVLLDLNMPRKDGRTVLAEIKGDAELRRIPVLVLTTSRDNEDVVRSYELGAASYILKPSSFGDLVGVMNSLSQYWGNTSQLPAPD